MKAKGAPIPGLRPAQTCILSAARAVGGRESSSQRIRHRINPMRTEVHVHGTIPLRSGASLPQIEAALQPWLDYLDVESLDELKSMHRDEPGLVFDSRRR